MVDRKAQTGAKRLSNAYVARLEAPAAFKTLLAVRAARYNDAPERFKLTRISALGGFGGLSMGLRDLLADSTPIAFNVVADAGAGDGYCEAIKATRYGVCIILTER